ncbi:MAG: hypothetical protein SGCHY_000332 [Lobulomycetales sp.]
MPMAVISARQCTLFGSAKCFCSGPKQESELAEFDRPFMGMAVTASEVPKKQMSSSLPYRMFMGQRVWRVPILRIYYPFILSGVTSFFVFSWLHTAFSNDPTNKWNNIVLNVEKGTAETMMKAEATEYYQKQLKEKLAK